MEDTLTPYGIKLRDAMVAVLKSSRIEGLTASNATLYWWSTDCWRNQFPLMSHVTLTWKYFELHQKIGL